MDLIDLLNMQPYKPQSVIVNFYNKKSAMGGHLDDGEPDQEHPILSFSIGLEGVFLIGGKSRSEGPVREIGVRGGDVVIMSGESRRRVHGVPRIRETAWIERWTPEYIENVIKELEEEHPH
jgi:alkylated DNA repair protein alkB family protein 1